MLILINMKLANNNNYLNDDSSQYILKFPCSYRTVLAPTLLLKPKAAAMPAPAKSENNPFGYPGTILKIHFGRESSLE